MWLYTKAAIIACLSIALIVGGWKAATWRLEAQAAEVLRHELRAEIQRRVRADADRLSLQVKLSEAEARVGTGVRIVTKTIKQYVKDTPDCRITSPAVINGLRDLRAGNVPAAPAQPASGRAAP